MTDDFHTITTSNGTLTLETMLGFERVKHDDLDWEDVPVEDRTPALYGLDEDDMLCYGADVLIERLTMEPLSTMKALGFKGEMPTLKK